MSDETIMEKTDTETAQTQETKTFTQEDVDRIVNERLSRQQRQFDKKLDGIDPDKARELLAKQEQAELEAQKQRGEFDSILKSTVEKKDAEINSVKKQSEAQRNKKSEVRDAAEKFTAEIDRENEELTQIYKTKDRSREDYYKALYEFEVQNERIRYIKGLLNQKKKLQSK